MVWLGVGAQVLDSSSFVKLILFMLLLVMLFLRAGSRLSLLYKFWLSNKRRVVAGDRSAVLDYCVKSE